MRARTFLALTAAFFAGALAFADAETADKPDSDKEAYLFAYFSDKPYGGRRGEAAGMRFAYSRDALKWTAMNEERPYLVPNVGEKKLLRDPSICRGPDGTYHLVWTIGWGARSIGHASSRDLLHWSAQEAIPVMEHEKAARNTWAPEVTYNPDDGLFYIYWATTISGRHGSGHRIYLTTTKDWKMFSPARLWLDPGYSAIDAALARMDTPAHKWLMVVKNEEKGQKNIRMLWTNDLSKQLPSSTSAPVAGDARNWVEGPSPLKVGNALFVYFDVYMKKRYGAIRSDDCGKTWRDVSAEVSFPKGTRHGTAFAVPRKVLDELLARGTSVGMGETKQGKQ